MMKNLLPAILGLTFAFLNPLQKEQDAQLPELQQFVSQNDWVVETEDVEPASAAPASNLEQRLVKLESRVSMLEALKTLEVLKTAPTTPESKVVAEECIDGTCPVQTYESVSSVPVAAVPVYRSVTTVPVYRSTSSVASVPVYRSTYGSTGSAPMSYASSSYGSTGVSSNVPMYTSTSYRSTTRTGLRGFFRRIFNRN